MKSVILGGVVFLSLVIAAASNLFACWGARPLSMGGAFIAVSDDVHSIYWNPAGLSKVKKFEITYTRWLDRRDNVNYDDFVGGAISLGVCTLGASYTYNQDKFDDYIINIQGKPHKIEDPRRKDDYVNLGCGAFLNKEGTLSVGLNIKSFRSTWRATDVSANPPDHVYDSDIVYLLDFGLLWDADPKLAFGILGQNFNEPGIFDKKMIFNLRPGIAWKPVKGLTYVFDLYDVLNNSNGEAGRNIRIGAEIQADKHVALRLGCYNINNSESKAYTAGWGLNVNGWKIDYGFMYWNEAGYLQHLLAFGYAY